MLHIMLVLTMFVNQGAQLPGNIQHRIKVISSKIDKYRATGQKQNIEKLLTSKDAKNMPYYEISGVIYDTATNPIPAGDYIYIYDAYTGYLISYIYPDINGFYADTLPLGAYIIQAKGDMYPSYYYTSHGGTGRIDSAQILWLTSDTDSINLIIQPGNVLMGTLYDFNADTPLINQYGSIEIIDTITKTIFWKTFSTDGSGAYTAEGLNFGNFKVRFHLYGYNTTYYGDSTDWFTSPVVAFAGWGDTITGIDAHLVSLGTGPQTGTGVITGHLFSDAGDTIKDPWPTATIVDANTNNYIFATFNYDTTTGIYTFEGLPTGTYKIKIDPADYLPQFYNNENDFSSADPISVTDGDTTYNVDFSFHRGGAIAGMITGLDGYGYTGAYYLDIYDSNTGDLIANKFGSTPDGEFCSGTELPTGTYKAFVYPTDIEAGQWYKDAFSFEQADSISVTAPDTTYGINFDFYGWTGVISGVVRDSDGNYIPASIDLYYANINEYVKSAFADTGRFIIRNLPEGSYKIYIYPQNGDSLFNLYIDQWYNGQETWENANTITLNQGDSIYLPITIQTGGRLTGSIIDSTTMTPIPESEYSFFVFFVKEGEGKLLDADHNNYGTYASEPIFGGNYKLVMVPNSWYDTVDIPHISYNPYHYEFYNNSQTYQNATSVNLPQDTVITVNFNTTKVNGAVEGSVMNGANPISDANYVVIVINQEGYPVATFASSDTSYYHVGGVLPGNYYVYLWPYGLWYNQVYSPTDIERVPYQIPNNASTVNVSGSTVTGINFDITGVKENNHLIHDNIGMSTVLKGNFLVIKGAQDIASISAFDVSGRKTNITVKHQQGQIKIDMSNLRKGVYFLYINKKDNSNSILKKIIKIK